MTALLERTEAPPVRRGRSSGWAPALRVARRELRRAPGRTLLVLMMVLLPVTAVVALDTLLRTGDISVVEGLPRDLGGAQGRIDPEYGGVVRQNPDLTRSESAGTGSGPVVLAEAQLKEVLPEGARLLVLRESAQDRVVRTVDGRVARATLLGLDLRDEASRGPWVVLRGRAPATAGEVAVTPRLERFGFRAGSTLLLPDGSERTVTGTVLYPRSYGAPAGVVGLPAAVGLPVSAPATRFWVSGPPVTWDDVLELNALGAAVLSRSVVLDPPSGDRVPELPSYDDLATTAAVLGLIVVMAVLEVVLLAGPAFAVGARRQRRALALMAAGGAEPRHVRRVVLAQGLLVGLTAAVVGAPLGIAVAALARRPLTHYADATWGPFDVSERDVALVCLLGAGTALLAALVPALVAARQPVVASLQGRRVTPGRAALPTAAGLALLMLGALMCVASLDEGFAELWVGFSALPTVIGAVLLAPVLLAALGRLAARLPLPLRYAVRDADRQRGRTAPAVAAIAATVAAVVALGTSAGSDLAEQRRSYSPSGPPGAAVVTTYGAQPDWAALAQQARRALPDEPVAEVRGVRLLQPQDGVSPFEAVQVCRPEEPAALGCSGFPAAYNNALGSGVLVGVGALDLLAPLLDPAALAAARRAVGAGGAAAAGAPGGQVELRRVRITPAPDGGQETALLLGKASAAVVPLVPRQGAAPTQVVVSEQAAARLGSVGTVGLVVGDGLTGAQERELRDALALQDSGLSVTVERGDRTASSTVVLLLGLAAGLLVLAGTLAATALALTEARPDLATLGAVGAPPRTRRTVAAAYAFVLALAGAVLGTLAGLVPGIAAAVAVTRGYGSTAYGEYGPLGAAPALARVDLPWLLIASLVVLLPLLAAAVAAASTRSRLPGVGRRVAA